MKRFILGFLVLACMTAVVFATFHFRQATVRVPKDIVVEFASEASSDFHQVVHLSAVVNQQQCTGITLSGGIVSGDLCQVVDATPGRVSIQVVQIESQLDGTPLPGSADYLLPVESKKPDRSQWTKHGTRLACAYLNPATLTN